jgi:hypothetical protein
MDQQALVSSIEKIICSFGRYGVRDAAGPECRAARDHCVSCSMGSGFESAGDFSSYLPAKRMAFLIIHNVY